MRVAVREALRCRHRLLQLLVLQHQLQALVLLPLQQRIRIRRLACTRRRGVSLQGTRRRSGGVLLLLLLRQQHYELKRRRVGRGGRQRAAHGTVVQPSPGHSRAQRSSCHRRHVR